MKKLLFLFVCLGLWLLNSCSNDLVETNEVATRSVGNRTYNIGSISESSLKTPAGLASLSSKLYKLVHPTGGASGIQVEDQGVIGKTMLRFKTEGNSPYYVICTPEASPGVYRITLKSKSNESDFNELFVRVAQSGSTITLAPIDAQLYVTRGIIQDIVGDLKIRAQRWWPCFKNFFLNTDQGQVIMFIGAFGGQPGQILSCIFAGVVALGCFG